MDLEERFEIHKNVSNFEMAPPKTIQMLRKLLIFVPPVESCHVATATSYKALSFTRKLNTLFETQHTLHTHRLLRMSN